MAIVASICRACDDYFEYAKPDGTPGRLRQYCDGCRNRGSTPDIASPAPRIRTVTCTSCDETFTYRRSAGGRPRRYCATCRPLCTECGQRSRRKKANRCDVCQRKPRPPRTCSVCEAPFTPKSGTQATCSRECSASHKRAYEETRAIHARGPLIACSECDQPVSRRRAKTCGSPKCRRLRGNAQMREWMRRYSEAHGVSYVTNRHSENRRVVAARRRARRRDAFVEDVDRAEIMRRDGWRCQLCKKPIKKDETYPQPLSPSIDHVIPLAAGRAAGGVHSMANAQAAHLICNALKSDRGSGEQLALLG